MRHKLLLIFFLFSSAHLQSAATNVNKQIRYHVPFAKEVYMVWGINNWQLPPDAKHLADSYLKGSLIYTKMKKTDKDFSVFVNVPKGSTVDFCFWITKGPLNTKLDEWDNNYGANEKDYHCIADENIISYIESDSSKVAMSTPIYFISYGLETLLFLGALVLFHFFIKKFLLRKSFPEKDPYTTLLSVSLALFIITLPLRASVTGGFWKFFISPSDSFPQILIDAFYDAIVLGIITIFFLTVIHFTRNSIMKKRIAFVLFYVCCAVYLIAEILNIKVVELLGLPFNYRWFAYSGFLKSTDAQNAMFSNINKDFVINTIATTCIVLPLIYFTYHLLHFIKSRLEMKKAIIISVAMCFCFFFFCKPSDADKPDYNKISNPVWAFLKSVGPFSSSLLDVNVNEPCELSTKNPESIDVGHKTTFGNNKIKNILVFVNESTPAEYIGLYNKKYNVTPVLDSYYKESAVFENIYAHAPATSKSMVSLLCSLNPWLSYNSVSYVYPNLKQPSIESELKLNDYRTAFFNSGDNEFQNTGGFLRSHAFDEIYDFKNNNCDKKLSTGHSDWKNCDGSDDDCLSGGCLNWIDKDKTKPFFTVLWTFQTHYPYFVTGEEKDYNTGDVNLNKYLNAVHHSDAVLGQIIEGLKKRGLYESTLIVVLGDHGEAFGKHNQTTHANNIYEENLHIPLVLINPSLFHGEWHQTLGAISDIGPTIFSVLQKKSPESWQGESLFNTKRHSSVFFYAPWSDYWFGMRENNLKYIYNATNDNMFMFDLTKDPSESINIADEHPDQVKHAKNKLAAWVHYQNEFMNKLFAKK